MHYTVDGEAKQLNKVKGRSPEISNKRPLLSIGLEKQKEEMMFPEPSGQSHPKARIIWGLSGGACLN